MATHEPPDFNDEHRSTPEGIGPKARLLIAMGLIKWQPYASTEWIRAGVGDVYWSTVTSTWVVWDDLGDGFDNDCDSEAHGLDMLAAL